MRSLAPLLAILALLPLAAASTVDLADRHVTLASVKLRPETEVEPRAGPYGALAPDEVPVTERAARGQAAMPAPAVAGAPYGTVTRGAVVEIHVGQLAFHLAAGHDALRPSTHLLLAGSDLVLPLTARGSAAAPLARPPSASEPPTLAPMAPALPPSAPAPMQQAPAPAPASADAPPVRTQGAAEDPEPAPRWSERAALAGAACVLLLTPLALYHRLRGAHVLGHDSRATLLDLLRRRPGISVAEAARELGVDPSTALYHLRRLVKEGIATAHAERRGARYFAAGSVAPHERARVVFERESAGLLQEIRATPGASKSALAQRVAIARATLHWHLARLERAGLIRCERVGREARVFPRQETFS